MCSSLQGVNLRGASLNGAQLTGTDLRGALLQPSQLSSVKDVDNAILDTNLGTAFGFSAWLSPARTCWQIRTTGSRLGPRAASSSQKDSRLPNWIVTAWDEAVLDMGEHP